MKKRFTISGTLSLIFIAVTVTFCITMVLSAKIFEGKVSDVNEKETMYSKISEIDQIARQHFYSSVDDKLIQDSLASGYIQALQDSEAKYYTASEVTAIQNISEGKRIGIGIEIQKDVSGYFKIINIDTDSPADIAELAKGDMITHINDMPLTAVNIADAREMLMGEEGLGIKINYLRDGEEKVTELTFSLYSVPTMTYSLEDTIGYINIDNFTESTASEVDYAVQNLISQGAQSFVVDLRYNASKNFTYAAEVADLFAKEGTVMSAIYKDGQQKVLYTSDKQSVTQPIVVIVNGQTGYAAEMLAVILKDVQNAKLVGTTTMGKGTLQTLYRLSDGSGIEFTTAKLVSPNNTEYNNVGLLPDYEKTLTADEESNFYDFTTATDPQIQRAFEVVKNAVAQQ